MNNPQIKTIASNGYEDEIDTITAALDNAVNQWIQFEVTEGTKIINVVPSAPATYKNSANGLAMIICTVTIVYEEEDAE